MRLGSKNKHFLIILILFFPHKGLADDKITSTPLINIEKIKPSFEEINESSESVTIEKNIREKKKKNFSSKSQITLIGLDKITAKSSKIMVKLNEVKKFGPLEIKILKCGKVKVNDKMNDVAYMQVKDLTVSKDDTVYIFNGWTFSSDPSLTPFDHAIYDLQLLSCFDV